jgi:hypothetical protein
VVGPIVRSNKDRNLYGKLRSGLQGLSAADLAHGKPHIAITNFFVRDRNGDVGPKSLDHCEKKGVADHPEVFGHAGILGNRPPDPDGLPFVSSSNVFKGHCTQSRSVN